MKTNDAVKHFGSKRRVAAALGISPVSVTQWGHRVPWQRQIELERLTGGVLRHNPKDIPEGLRAVVSQVAA